MPKFSRILFFAVVWGCSISRAHTQENHLSVASPSPEAIGKKLAERFIPGKHFLHQNRWIHYPEVCTWLGALRFADITKDTGLIKQLQSRFAPLFSSQKDLLPPKDHVDMSMFGSLPLTLYQLTGEQKYLDLGLPYADSQWVVPANATAEEKNWSQKGLSWQSRLWIDDMYMITILQVMAYKVTGNPVYIDRAAKEMAFYLDQLQRENGLFYHAADVPFYWGRGNGWMAAGMAELLRALPEAHPCRLRILKGYVLMMKNLIRYQTKEGMWNQLVDDPDCWAETSASAMFAYAMTAGINNGWLQEESYKLTVKKAWSALSTYIDGNGDMTQVCAGTNKKNDRQYYYDRPRLTGDLHGQAPMLWLATELAMENSPMK